MFQALGPRGMAAPTHEPGPNPVKLLYSNSSPLESLVRRTSSRRARNQAALQVSSPVTTPVTRHSPSPNQMTTLTAPIAPFQTDVGGPPSPLLHSRFRGSVASTSSHLNGSSDNSLDTSQDTGYHYYDDESIYSDLTENDCLSRVVQPVFETNNAYDGISEDVVASCHSKSLNAQSHTFTEPRRTDAQDSFSQGNPSPPPVPTVVISSPREVNADASFDRQGRTPIVGSAKSNYSRPDRPGHPPRPDRPPIIPSEDQKRRVLERNSPRIHSPLASPSNPATAPRNAPSPLRPYTNSPSPTPSSSMSQLHDQVSASSSTGSFLFPRPPPTSLASLSNTSNFPSSSQIALPKQPPSRPETPGSPYSTYSFYDLGSGTPSPTGSQFASTPSSTNTQHTIAYPLTTSKPRTPQDYLQLGIQHHESNRLKDSAACFEKSAKEQGGCGVGMLMWGLTLRHGWGCEKNEKHGFKWLTKAAESAVVDLEKAKGGGLDSTVLKTELVIAIYEVGQCFFQGWGVVKDKNMAVSYYRVAANLGDADAQQDLAFCLLNGKGCKKDKNEAAKWYRAAVAQGASDVGLAWIYKDKYKI